MSGKLEIRICRESFIQEIERLYHPQKADYFSKIAHELEENSAFSQLSFNTNEMEYRRFMQTIKKFNNPDRDYYNRSSNVLKELLQLKDARIWMKKETLELEEAILESYDNHVKQIFVPLLNQMEHGQVFLFMLKDIPNQDSAS